MFSHVTVGTNDFAKARRFYTAIMEVMGHKALMDGERVLCFGELKGPKFFVLPPFDGRAAQRGNGVHAAFIAKDHTQVDAFHGAALANGGTDEGAPGLRPQYHAHYYGAYVRDPDGNKLQAVCHRKTP